MSIYNNIESGKYKPDAIDPHGINDPLEQEAARHQWNVERALKKELFKNDCLHALGIDRYSEKAALLFEIAWKEGFSIHTAVWKLMVTWRRLIE